MLLNNLILMANQNNIAETNPFIQEISDNLNMFIENIKCLRETFGYSEGMLNQQKQNADKTYADFIAPYKKENENGYFVLNIPNEKLRNFKKIERKKKRAKKAFQLIPPTYIISAVSIFDSFLAGLIRCIYSLKPELLLESNMNFLYRELVEYDSIKEVKKKIVETTIEKLFRDSHTEQIVWIEKSIGIKTLRDFAGWPNYIELTERRNLFVHSDGVVSSQYIDECKKSGYEVDGISIGSRLLADKTYFEQSYNLLYEMAIMLTQILINKLYIGKYSEDTSERDNILITCVFDLIVDKHYEIAINVSNFAYDGKTFKRNLKDKAFIELNLAQAYKWSGKHAKCKELLDSMDVSIMNNDLKIPKLTLEDNFDAVYPLMISVGDGSEILKKDSYRDWPIFKEIRKKKEFADTFKKIFNEELVESNTTTKVEAVDNTTSEKDIVSG